MFGSLIFGVYDGSRFTPNDLVFTMTGDNLRDIVVTTRSTTSTTPSGNTTLMSSPEFAFIDFAVPEIWLPVKVCNSLSEHSVSHLTQLSDYTSSTTPRIRIS